MRLNLLILLLCILGSTLLQAQNNSVAIGQSTTNPNAVLLLVGNGSQGLIIPTVANVSTLNFTTGEKGMVVFDGTSGKVQYFDGTAWNVVGGSGSGTPYTINYNVGTNSVELKQGSATVSTTPIAIGKKPLTSTIPTDTQVLMYNQQSDSWIGTSFSGDVKIVASTANTSGTVNVTGLKGKPLPANFSAGTLTSDASGNLSWAAAGAVVTLANGQILTGNGTTNAATTLSGDASLSGGALTVTGIQGKAIPTLPTAAALQLLSYNGTLNQWEFKDPSGTNIMLKTVYDPTGKAADAFDLTKHSGVLSPSNGGTGLSLPLSGGQILTGNGTTNAATTLSGDASLNGGALKITGIQGIPVSATLPTNNQVLQYNGSNWTPATLSSGTVTSVTGGTGLTGGTITTTGTLGVDVGTTANKIVQLDANAKLPAVDGSALTNLNASNITSGTLPLGRIATGTNGQVLTMVAGTPAWASASLPPSGNLTSSTTGVTITGGTAAVLGSSGTSITIQNATGSQPGLLTGTDWTTFNNKMGSGTSAGGDLSGSYPNPTVSKLQGTSISATTPTNNQVLQYNGSNWAPATLGGTTFGNLTTTTTGLTITGGTGAVAGTGVTIDLQSASATQAGLLTAADWSTFNGKQNALILTTAGTSGVATLVGNTLNIPNYTSTPYTAGTGLTLAANAFSVNAAQNITTLTNLTTKGLVTTTGAGTLGSTQGTGFLKDNGTGTVTYDNSTYLTSYTETDPAVKAINGLVKSNGTTISAATAGTDYQSPLVSGTNIKTINGTSVLGAGNITAVTTETDPSVTAINGLVKSNGTTVSAAVAGTDYVATETDPAVKAISGIVKSNGTTIIAATAGTDYQAPLVSGTTIKTINGTSVLGAGNITAVTTEADPTVTSINGLVKSNGTAVSAAVAGTDYIATETDPFVKAINGLVKSNGTTISAAVPGTDYLTGNQTITLSGDITGSGTTAITTTVSKINGSSWPANASGSLTNDGTGNLTWVPSGGSGTVTSVATGTGLTGGPITTSGTLSVDVGTTANKIVQLDATGKLPAIDGSQLTNLPVGTETDPTVKAINGLVKSNGTTISAAVAGTDYVATETDPSVKAISGIVKSNGTTISAATAGTDYQSPLVSGTNIKTINGASVLGAGNITAVTTETDPTVTAINGLVKSNGTTISAATAGTDYVATETDPSVKAINGLVKSNGTTISAATVGTDYQAPITLTTTGTSGVATLVGNTLNVPNYTATTYLAGTGLALTGNTFSLSSVTTTEILDGTIADIDISGTGITSPGKVSGGAIISGTIGGSTGINSTGSITISSSISDAITGNSSFPGGTGVVGSATGATGNGVTGYSQSGWGVYGVTTSGYSGIFIGGNVGIGTTTPAATLDVTGTIKITDGTQGAGKVLTSDANGLASWQAVSGTGTVTNVAAGTGLTGGPITTSGTLSVDVGTTANKIIQLDATGKLPAVDGSQLTNLPAGTESDPTVKAINGLVKSNGTTISAAVAGTDYIATETDPSVKAINGLVKSNGTTISAATAGTDYQAPLVSGTTIKTINGTSVLGAGNITAVTTETDPTVTAINGLVKSNGTTISAATAGTDYQAPITLTTTGTSGVATLVGNTLNVPNYTATSYLAGTGLALTGNTFSLSSVTTTEILDGTIADIDISGSANINGAKINPTFGAQNVSTTGTLTTGSAGQFVVDASGNITKINNITTSFPSSQGAANSVLTNDGAGNLTWASGSGWGLTGNAGTVDGTNFIGTTDDVPLSFRMNNIVAGVIGSQASQTTSFGLFSSGSGNNNTALGFFTLNGNTGTSNTAVGTNAMRQTSGTQNTAVGAAALSLGTTPDNNTAIGFNSLRNSSAAGNTGLGKDAGVAITSGTNNTILGHLADVSSGTLTNATAIGYNAKVGASNSLVLGGTGADAVNVGIGTTAPSSLLSIKATSLAPNSEKDIITLDSDNGGTNSGSSIQFKNNVVGAGYVGAIAGLDDGTANGRLEFRTATSGPTASPLTSANTKMVIKANGNIGIGTINPLATLDIAGNIKIADGTQGAGKVLTSDAAGLASWQAVSGTGTVTNVTGSGPISVATGTTTPAISITQANGTTDGYLSSADWNTFNGKQGALTLTTTGTSGVATLVGNTLNVPNYAGTSYLAGTGLTLTTNTFSVNTSQNISTLSNLTTNGLIKTTGGTGALSIATAGTDYVATETDPAVKAINGLVKSNGTTISAAVAGTDYLTTNQTITLSGDITGSGTTAITTAIGASKVTNTMLAGSIAASKLIGTDINTVGTITTGTWNGTKVDEAHGGTNQTTYATGDMLYASASNVLSKLGIGTAGQVLTIAGGVPTWATASNGWGLTGNAGTSPATNFIGTTDAQSLIFKVNNINSGRIDVTTGATFFGNLAGNVNSDGQSVGFGANALAANTTGINNTAVGVGSLSSNITGGGNTAMGGNALSNNLANSNSAFGASALWLNTTGTFNVAMGNGSLQNNTTGDNNTATGGNTLLSNTSGTQNTAVGADGLGSNTTGNNNTAVGSIAMNGNTTGNDNTAVGFYSLYNNLTGSGNSASGRQALFTNTTGSNNTAVGFSSLPSNVSGSNNTGLGFATDVLTGNLTNATAIGYNAKVGASNSLVLGGTGADAVKVGIGVTAPIAALEVSSSGATSGSDAFGVKTSTLGGGAGGSTTYGLYSNAHANGGTTSVGLYAFGQGGTNNWAAQLDGNTYLGGALAAGGLSAFGTAGQVLTSAGPGLAPTWSSGSGWSLTGNAGTVDGTSFIGTTDNIPLSFRVNNQKAARIESVAGGATFFGFQSGNVNTGVNNSAMGYQALKVNAAGVDNTAVGFSSLISNTSGSQNTGIGSGALQSNVGGGGNTAIGYISSNVNTAGSNNTSLGYSALRFNTVSNNTAIGYNGMSNNTTGGFNVSLGDNAGTNNTTGTNNTLIGSSANVGSPSLVNATALGSGASVNASNSIQLGNAAVTTVNVGTGTTATLVAGGLQITGGTLGVGRVLTSDASGNATWQIGGSGWGLTGNTGTVDGTNFIGTTDNVALNFKVNNQKAGRIDPAGPVFLGNFAGMNNTDVTSTGIGNQALQLNTTGSGNTGVGYWSLGNNSTGSFNVGVGYGTLTVNTTGASNAAIGYSALYSNTTGQGNAGFGSFALNSNTTGSFNTTVGVQALYSNVAGSGATAIGKFAMLNANSTTTPFNNTNVAVGYQSLMGSGTPAANTGLNNTAVGYQTLMNNSSGDSNVALGTFAGQANTTGNYNLAIGNFALSNNSAGIANIAVGYDALFSNTGGQNTAIGHNSLISNTTGGGNTAIGYNADVTSGTLVNATVIGANATVSTSNTIQLGSSGVTTVNVGTGTTATLVAGGLQITGGTPAVGKVLTSDATGIATWQAAGSGTGWTLTGNGSIVDATNFIGSTNNVPLNFRANNLIAGRVDPILLNTFFGPQAGNTTSTGGNNVGLGYIALTANISGVDNVAIGYGSMKSNRDGVGNVAVGRGSLFNLHSTGVVGGYNVAVGYQSLYQTESTAASNGVHNVGVGFNAGQGNVNGTNNTFIGDGADATNLSSFTNATAIGSGAIVTASNTIQLGDPNVTMISSVGDMKSVKGGFTNPFTPTASLVADLEIYREGESSTARLMSKPTDNQVLQLFGQDKTTGNVKGYAILRFNDESLVINQNSGTTGTSLSSTNRMIFDGTTGNVMIGPSGPAKSKLDVTGGVTIGSSYAAVNAAPTDGAIIQGNVGIGTTNPNGFSGKMVHLAGTGNTAYVLEKTDATARKWAMVTGGSGEYIIQDATASINAFFMEPGVISSQLYLKSGGNIGIGTSFPGVPLDIATTTSAVFLSGGSNVFFNNLNGGALSTGTNPTPQISVRATGSFLSTGSGLNGGFYVTSDERIKRKVGVSDSKNDLSTLMNLKVTDYKFVDSLNVGNVQVKGVFAQEVEKVYPQAISKQTGFIPNIYALADRAEFNEAKQTLSIIMAKPHNLTVGDKVKLISSTGGEKPATVSAVDGNSFTVAGWTEKSEKIFVFGKEVNDFRIVDYDRLFTLNLSATQELFKMIEDQKKVIDELKSKEEESKKKIALLEASLNKATSSENELKSLKSEIEKIKQALGLETTAKKD